MPGVGNTGGWASGPVDFSDEFGIFRKLMSGGIKRIDDETSTLDKHSEKLKNIKLSTLLDDSDEIQSIKADVLQARKTVLAVEKFLKEDCTKSLKALRDALARYIKALADKIDYKKIQVNAGKGALTRNAGVTSVASGKNFVSAAKLLADLKQLEIIIANLENQVQQLAEHEDIDGFDVENRLDDAIKNRDKERQSEKHDAESEEKRQQQEDERRRKDEEEKRRREEEERKRKAEEEERRRLVEEERRKREEEERLRREEEERRRKAEEEERRRREEEERLRKEEEERRRREEEEQKRKAEEEERKRIEEEARRRKEEEERLRREEEERRRKAEEEERKRREEEERRRREEEEARRREDERLWKADPRDWPALIYHLSNGYDPLGTGVVCVIRAPDDYLTLHKDQFVCEFVSWEQNRYRPADSEEVVSSMIRLRPADGTTMNFKTRVWIAIAHAGAPRNRETVIRFQAVNSAHSSVVEKRDHAQSETSKGYSEEIHGTETEDDDSSKHQRTDSRFPAVPPMVSVSAPTNPVARGSAPPAAWNDVMTRDTIVNGYENFHFVETPITELDADGVNIIVVTRPKADSDTWNNKGGRIISSVDSRVSITAPKNAFRIATHISLQVIALDSSALNGVKERYDTCDELIGSSPMLLISMSSSPSKPITVSVTNPSGGGKKPRTDHPGQFLPHIGKSHGIINGSSNDQAGDVLSVLVKDAGGKWRHRDSIALDQQHDCVVFQLDEAPQCVVILRTQPGVDSAELCRIAADLETSVHERPAQLVVRQHADNPNLVFIECCRRDNVDKLISGRLQTSQFTDGPDPSRLFVLREGDLVEVTFRDNIRAVDGFDGPRRFIFNSNLATIDIELNVGEVAPYAQNALDVYRGYIRLSLVERVYLPPPRLATTTSVTAADTGRRLPSVIANNAAADKNMVAEVLLNLPKPNKDRNKINRMNIGINGPHPLCAEYFDKLAADLGDDWLELATKLKVVPVAVQRIIRENSDANDPVLRAQRAARVMLGQWYRSQSKSNQKVEDLKEALIAAGRNDLADDLYSKYKAGRMEQDRKLEDIRLQKATRIFLDSSSAVKAWREVGVGLGLSVGDLDGIGGPEPPLTARKVAVDVLQARGLAQQMLDRWKESAGQKATSESLLVVVRKAGLTDVAAKMSSIRDGP